MRELQLVSSSSTALLAVAGNGLQGWWEDVNEVRAWQDGAFFSLTVAYALVSTVALDNCTEPNLDNPPRGTTRVWGDGSLVGLAALKVAAFKVSMCVLPLLALVVALMVICVCGMQRMLAKDATECRLDLHSEIKKTKLRREESTSEDKELQYPQSPLTVLTDPH